MARLSEEEKARRAENRRRKAALAAEEDAVRRERRHREWDANGTRLTRAELEAGVRCRGCGQPIIDRLGDWPALMKMGEEQRREYEAADADFKARHSDCRAGRWSMAGSRTDHCCFCCPPPPLSLKQIENIQAIFANVRTPNPAEHDTWRLTLTCEHVIDKTQHSSNTYWSRSVVDCPTCGCIRGIVTSERLPPNSARHAAEHQRLTAELDRARSEHERYMKKAEAARRRIDKLKGQLHALGPAPQAH